MNDRIKELTVKAGFPDWSNHAIEFELDQFAGLMTAEFIGLLEYEIAMLEKYKTTSCNDFDRRWHEGKIVHFRRMIDKTKDHFGVEE
jgi:hypothetical protein